MTNESERLLDSFKKKVEEVETWSERRKKE